MKAINQLLKLCALLLLFTITGCEDDNGNLIQETVQQETESHSGRFQSRYISGKEIPHVSEYLNKKTNDALRKSQQRSSGKDVIEGAVFEMDNILETVHETDFINYSFTFYYPDEPDNVFYNLVVGREANGELGEPYVLKYVSDEAGLEEYLNNDKEEYYFSGDISLYGYETFFSENILAGKPDECEAFDANGDPLPCGNTTYDQDVINILNGGTVNGTVIQTGPSGTLSQVGYGGTGGYILLFIM